jgi:hypothetical protein
MLRSLAQAIRKRRASVDSREGADLQAQARRKRCRGEGETGHSWIDDDDRFNAAAIRCRTGHSAVRCECALYSSIQRAWCVWLSEQRGIVRSIGLAFRSLWKAMLRALNAKTRTRSCPGTYWTPRRVPPAFLEISWSPSCAPAFPCGRFTQNLSDAGQAGRAGLPVPLGRFATGDVRWDTADYRCGVGDVRTFVNDLRKDEVEPKLIEI